MFAASLNPITQAIAALYGVVGDINDFLDKHIEGMKKSDNPTIARTGRVLDMAKYGFGLGYLSSVVVIAVGQYLLGNTLSAISTIATAATLSNPVAMTCAAFGAVYYGWGALSTVERDEILDKLQHGLGVGVELIKAIIRFVTEKTHELLNSRNFEEIKHYIATGAEVFGKKLGDVTHRVGDVVGDGLDTLKEKSGKALNATAETAGTARDLASDALHSVARNVSGTAAKAQNSLAEAAEKIRQKMGKDGK